MLKLYVNPTSETQLVPTKIRYNSVNHQIIIQIIRVQLVYKSLSFGGWLYLNWTPLVILTIRIVRSKLFCEEPTILWSTMRIYWCSRIYGSFIYGSQKWSPNTRTYVFFVSFGSLKPKVQKSVPSILMWFHTGSVLICCWGCDTGPLKSTSSRKWFE